MKTIAIYGRSFDPKDKLYIQTILSQIENYNGKICVYEDFYKLIKNDFKINNFIGTFKNKSEIKDSIDYFISIGGDGTLLDTITLVENSNIPIMGVNVGKLGFLSSTSAEDVNLAIDSLFKQNYIISERTLLSIKKIENSKMPEINYALNDITISKKDSNAMINIHAYVDDVFLNSYWADGLIVATPTGSTAYSLSCSGPILTPNSSSFIINAIAPHNLSVRPIIIPDNSKIKLVLEGSSQLSNLTLDSKTYTIKNSSKIYIEKEKFKIKLVNMHENDFFQVIRDKLMWGSDIRN